jgi:hypothetical protein
MSKVLASGITLKLAEHPEGHKVFTDFQYGIWSQGEQTTYTCDVTFRMLTDSGQDFEMKVDVGDIKVPSVDAGFDKLADWFERTAKVLRERKPTKTVPIYNR